MCPTSGCRNNYYIANEILTAKMGTKSVQGPARIPMVSIWVPHGPLGSSGATRAQTGILGQKDPWTVTGYRVLKRISGHRAHESQ